MDYIKRVFFTFLQATSVIMMFPLIFIALFLPSIQKAKLIGIWAKFNIFLLKLIFGLTYRVQGAENIPDQPGVIMANHQSDWETLAFQEIFPAQSYILKKELFYIPFFGWGLAANEPIAIDRSQKQRALNIIVSKSKERVNNGRWIVIFPEGTRQPYGESGKYQVGGSVVANKLGVTVLPVAHNAGKFWPKSAKKN